jgi:tRNA-(MS[2]IO[6]A)-hydroxylase (MiaE)-like
VTEAQRRDDASREPREARELDPDGGPGPQGGPSDEGIIDLLGLLAYAELDAYFRLTEDAALAPSLADKAALAGMAAAEFGHFRLLCEQLSLLGAQPEQAMLPFAPALDAFHARTAPADWLEGLVKAYVGDAIAADFYRAVAELVDPQTRDLVLRVLADTGHAEFVIARVRAAIATDPHLAGRLALWARRLVGEALAQAYRVVADRRSLAGLLARAGTPAAGTPEASAAAPAEESPAPAAQLGDIGRMLARLTDAHAQRMSALGLASLSGAPDTPGPPESTPSGWRNPPGAARRRPARRRRSCWPGPGTCRPCRQAAQTGRRPRRSWPGSGPAPVPRPTRWSRR